MTNAVHLAEEEGIDSTSSVDALKQWSEAISDDLRQLAVLHDREVDKEFIAALREVNFPYNLGLVLASLTDEESDNLKPQQLFATVLQEMPEALDQTILDRLAVDYAEIYLNHSLHASPFESVWLDEDHLLQQEPMFQVREWYQRYGLETENWRIRSDDHLVLQLQFIATLLDPDAQLSTNVPLEKRLQDATQFMDEHLLIWVSDFCKLVSQRCNTDYYAAVAVLTDAYLQELRDMLVEITEIPRPTAEELEKKRKANMPVVEEPISFIPGVAESW